MGKRESKERRGIAEACKEKLIKKKWRGVFLDVWEWSGVEWSGMV